MIEHTIYRTDGTPAFTARIDCGASVSESVKRGLAVRWAIETYVGLTRLDLRGADLTELNLAGADLADANLINTNLFHADLSDANLFQADLRRANLTSAVGIIGLGNPNGFHAHAWTRDGILSIRVGCQEKRLNEARAYWSGKPDRREVLAAVEYAAAIAAAREWRVS